MYAKSNDSSGFAKLLLLTFMSGDSDMRLSGISDRCIGRVCGACLTG
jgi:hypothetical protein